VSHIRNRLSPQSIRALLCLGAWCAIPGLIKDSDVQAVTILPAIDGDEDVDLEAGWDSVVIPSK
jgi:hypothetical protein